MGSYDTFHGGTTCIYRVGKKTERERQTKRVEYCKENRGFLYISTRPSKDYKSVWFPFCTVLFYLLVCVCVRVRNEYREKIEREHR